MIAQSPEELRARILKAPPPSPSLVFGHVEEALGLPPRSLKSPSRERRIVWGRMMATKLLRDAGATYPLIGMWMGGRHHSTIMEQAQRWERLRESNPTFAAFWRKVEATAPPDTDWRAA